MQILSAWVILIRASIQFRKPAPGEPDRGPKYHKLFD